MFWLIFALLIILLAFLRLGFCRYTTSQVKAFVNELTLHKQAYWAKKVEKCFTECPWGTNKYSSQEHKELWKDCCDFIKKYDFSDKKLKRIARIMNVFYIAIIGLIALGIAYVLIVIMISSLS